MSGKVAFKRHNAPLTAALSLLALLWIIPVLWMLSLSLQPDTLLARTTSNTALGLIPIPFTWENYLRLFTFGHTPRWFLNSVVVTSATTLLVLTFSSMAGYALARIPFRGRALVYPLVLAGLVIPEQAVFVPMYTMFADWRLHDTYFALIAPRLGSPLGVFLMAQFFRGIPDHLEEAAFLDGANRWTTFTKIVLPLARPTLTALGIVTALYAWNDYLWPLVSVQSREMFTITLGLAGMQSNFAQSEGLGRVMASGVVASAPILFLFLLFQRLIVKGIAPGSGK